MANVPLKDVTMERMRVEELGESKDEDCVPLKILSRSSLHFVGIKGIYTCMCLESEESVFPKQSWPAAWPNNLTEPQVPAAR